jgi:hypothetical protein
LVNDSACRGQLGWQEVVRLLAICTLDRFSTDTDLRRRKSLARATQHHYDDVM